MTVAVTGASGALGAAVALDGVQTLFLVSGHGWIGSSLALRTGEGSVTSRTVERLTGTRPLDLAGFLATEPSSWAHLSR